MKWWAFLVAAIGLLIIAGRHRYSLFWIQDPDAESVRQATARLSLIIGLICIAFAVAILSGLVAR
jgi:hypothetical protein